MSGYFRWPTIFGGTVVFTCEDDLWSVPAGGGLARRLTTSLGAVKEPAFSPDGSQLAFLGREDGAWEVYVMPSEGGEALRLTYQGRLPTWVGWLPDGAIVYASCAGEPFWRKQHLWRISPRGGLPERLAHGVANRIAHGPDGAMVLARHAADPARWKRYRGGTAGQLWIDTAGSGGFVRLQPAKGNITSPLWIGRRLFFISDHEGVGNLYSCTPTGRGLRRHTHHEEFYVRGASTDGSCIVYHAGADLYLADPAKGAETRIEVDFHSARVQRRKRFAEAANYLHEVAPHPEGHSVALSVRGQCFTMANWEGAAIHQGAPSGVRYRLLEWLNDGKRFVTVSDATGEEFIEIHHADGAKAPLRLDKLDTGRILGMTVSPTGDKLALRNQRLELLAVDLGKRTIRRLDQSRFGPIGGPVWSPDGCWIAYSYATSIHTRCIRVVHAESGKIHEVTRPEFKDLAPAWDPEGQFLYFLSYRVLEPVYDAVHFDLGFPEAAQPMLVTLRKDAANPFLPTPQAAENAPNKDEGKKKRGVEVHIDFAGIQDRVLAFPVKAGRYGRIEGIEGKALYTVYPVVGSLEHRAHRGPSRGSLMAYTFKSHREEVLITDVTGFSLSRNRKMLFYLSGRRLRAVKAGEKPPEPKKEGMVLDRGRSTGWIDLGRIKVEVDPPREWRQMYREAWRLQRDHFWSESMSGVDWQHVYERYAPLLDRIGCRSEFSDLLWEMQGELGTSHAYEIGGDYRLAPHAQQGYLGAEFTWDARRKGYRAGRILEGDSWDVAAAAPMAAPGVGPRKNEVLIAINGRLLDGATPPCAALRNLGGHEVELTFRGVKGATRKVTTVTLCSESALCYRDMVRRNRAYVHKKTGGRVGYIHIPDMMALGYAEFHRAWLAEVHRPGLLIDVRYNGGGHVSQLLLEKLARRRIGYDVMRYGEPIPYPDASVLGPIAAVANESAGSDGDIFSHAFKMMRLGKLVGTRTWGGVIGITRNQFMVDHGLTTQPEFSFWFEDVGWELENHGAVPDVEIDIAPQDYREDRDPQLDTAIALLEDEMKARPPRVPTFENRPHLPLPKLPKA
jgi:tricorn protease